MKRGKFLKRWQSKCNLSPPNPSLLGLNIGGGAEAKLRLRRPNNEWDFSPIIKFLTRCFMSFSATRSSVTPMGLYFLVVIVASKLC
ncbi:hypothetical protein ACS0TY_024271 [Phlomoides rotata]